MSSSLGQRKQQKKTRQSKLKKKNAERIFQLKKCQKFLIEKNQSKKENKKKRNENCYRKGNNVTYLQKVTLVKNLVRRDSMK